MQATPLTIIYLSETGVGQTIAERLHSEADRNGVKSQLFCASEHLKIAWAQVRLLVVIASSTGDGDPPEKAIKFWRWLKAPEQAKLLTGCEFALLGLGDSNYSTYMGMPRRLHAQLLTAGGVEFMPKQEADDATPNGLESAIEPWIERLWSVIKSLRARQAEKSGAPSDAPAKTPSHPKLPDVRIAVIAAASGEESSPLRDVEKEILLTIDKARWLTGSEALKPVLLLSCKRFGEGVLPKFAPGDVISLRCPNLIEEVESVLRRLPPGEHGHVRCDDQSRQHWPAHIPLSVTAANALSWYVDLAAPPSKRLLKDEAELICSLQRAWAEYCSDPSDRQRLMDLCEISAAGKDKYAALMDQEWQASRVLASLPSCRPPLATLLALLPPARPRHYSLASVSSDSVEIVFTVYRNRNYRGVCTTWLQRLSEISGLLNASEAVSSQELLRQLHHWTGHREEVRPIVSVHFMPPTRFRLTEPLKVPVIMAAQGTGVAPFRAFLQHMSQERQSSADVFPENHLFVGCRSESQDLLFANEWKDLLGNGVLKELHVAASRQNPDRVVYVQHLVEEKAQLIVRVLMREGGHMYVCGDPLTMGTAVERAVVACLQRVGQLSEEAALAFMAQLKEERRYLLDVWT